MAPVTADWSFWELFVPQAMRGVGIMFCIVPVTNLALGDMNPGLMKSASGLLNLTRNSQRALEDAEKASIEVTASLTESGVVLRPRI